MDDKAKISTGPNERARNAERLGGALHLFVARRLGHFLAGAAGVVRNSGAGAGDRLVARPVVGAGGDLGFVVHADLSSPVLMTRRRGGSGR